LVFRLIRCGTAAAVPTRGIVLGMGYFGMSSSSRGAVGRSYGRGSIPSVGDYDYRDCSDRWSCVLFDGNYHRDASVVAHYGLWPPFGDGWPHSRVLLVASQEVA